MCPCHSALQGWLWETRSLTESGLGWEAEQGARKTHCPISRVSSPELSYKKPLIPNAHSKEKCQCLVVFLGLLWTGREKYDIRHQGLSHACSSASLRSPPDPLYFNSAAKSERKVTVIFWQSSCTKGDHKSTTWPSGTSVLRSFPFPSPFQALCQKTSQNTPKWDVANKTCKNAQLKDLL